MKYVFVINNSDIPAFCSFEHFVEHLLSTLHYKKSES